MKRLLFSLALTLFAAAFAQAADRDVLVTPEGTIFTIESQYSSWWGSPAEATQLLGLSVQNGTYVTRTVVPESMTAGNHFSGALAYDSDSRTLFVLWIHSPNWMSSEILLATYHDGQWQPAVSIDSQSYHMRSNLRVGITRRVSQLQNDGSYNDIPALLLHAIWWDDSGSGQEARYALLTSSNGVLATPETHSLREFLGPDDNKFNTVDPNFNPEILRHPAIVSSPMQSTVDIVFGDIKTNSVHQVTLHPIADHRIHIPGGIGGPAAPVGGKPMTLAAPPTFSADWKGPITVIEHGDRLVFANSGDASLNYITYANNAWSAVKSIPIDNRFPAEAALAAVDKMLSAQ
jgi:hypothetical protein